MAGDAHLQATPAAQSPQAPQRPTAAGAAGSDAAIAHAAQRLLQWINDLPRHDLRVAVANGWITLCGAVTWDYQRLAALSAVRNLPGVAGLSDRIELVSTALALAIRYEIESGLLIHAGTRTQDIRVAVTRIDVSLSGTARSQAERDFACRLAANTPGVRRVHDNINVVPA